MHYYQFNIGDYSSHTKHLTPLEDICYRRLLDWYYLHEKPIPKDINMVARMLMLNGCLTEVEQVLKEFFVQSKTGWINPRADKEIDAYHNKVLSSSKAGKISAEKRKAYKQQTLNEPSSNVQPTINHKTTTNKHKTKIDDTFKVSDRVKEWAKKNNYQLNMIEKHKNYFITACQANGYEREDWDAYFIKAIVDNWLGSSNPKGGCAL